MFYTYLSLLCYLVVVIVCIALKSQKVTSSSDFVIGSRNLNYWLTAMSAHASDMSSWLFMGYPAVIYMSGIFNAWTAIGLMLCMWLNWKYVAPSIRVATEELNCSTMSGFFEKRFNDTSGFLGVLSALFCLVFYAVYICAGLVGLGLLLNTLFEIPYSVGISIGTLIVIAYVSLGGYFAIAWLDLIQGIFLLAVIIFVPIYLMTIHKEINLFEALPLDMIQSNESWTIPTFIAILSMVFGWGLGYFGQPHIITKFMGINHVSEIHKSKMVGMVWMGLALAAATCVGLIGAILLKGSVDDPQMVFVALVQQHFNPFFVGLILCAIIAATINVICSQILVLSSTISEDIYRKVVVAEPSSAQLLRVSRLSVVGLACIACAVALFNNHSIYNLVLYAWSGLGASFGPLMIYSLYAKQFNKYAAYIGIISGGATAGLWPFFQPYILYEISPLVPGFIVSFILISFSTKLLFRWSDQEKVVNDTNPQQLVQEISKG